MSAWQTDEGRKAEEVLRKEGMLEWENHADPGGYPYESLGQYVGIVYRGIDFRGHKNQTWGRGEFIAPRVAEDILNGAAIRWLERNMVACEISMVYVGGWRISDWIDHDRHALVREYNGDSLSSALIAAVNAKEET